MPICCLHSFVRSNSRKLRKVNTLIGRTLTHLVQLRNLYQTRCAQAKGDATQFLLLGQLDRAIFRVEEVIRARNMIDALAMIESYCQLMMDHPVLLHVKRECPEELREAAAGLSFASSRCGELPELLAIRRIFSSIFGSEFTFAAIELRSNSGVNRQIVQKLSSRQPSLELRAKITKEIAKEHGIEVELIVPNSENMENFNLERKSKATPISEPSCTSIDMQKHKDVESAIQGAFKLAENAATIAADATTTATNAATNAAAIAANATATASNAAAAASNAAAAAKIALELYQLELDKNNPKILNNVKERDLLYDYLSSPLPVKRIINDRQMKLMKYPNTFVRLCEDKWISKCDYKAMRFFMN